MKKLLTILLILLVIPSVAAQTVEQEIDDLVNYAEQYEMGNIDYFELNVHSSIIRSNINELLGEYRMEEHGPGGITEEAAIQFFGAPRDYTKHAWDMSEDRETILDQPTPWFEKIIFDGKRIKISFNAWPHVYTKEGKQIIYYWTDFRLNFKKYFDFNINQMVSEVQSSAASYLEGSGSADQVADKLQEYEPILWEYIEENRENCKETVGKLFSESDKQSEEKRTRYYINLFENEKGNIFVIMDTPDCSSDCEHRWINYWPEVRMEMEMEGGGDYDFYKREDFQDYSYEELQSMYKDALSNTASSANSLGNNQGSWSNFDKSVSEMRAITEAMLEIKVWTNHGSDEGYNEVLNFVEGAINAYDVEKETISELRYENRLVTNSETHTEAWCRETGWYQCEWDSVCMNGDCVTAIGGAEDCGNGVDDDGDTVADCDDPDCAVECGRACAPVCEDECWPCNGEKCEDVCKDDCWECDWETEDCESRCVECNSCADTNCRSQSFCTNCMECENNQRPKEDCNTECQPCTECIENYPLEEAGMCEVACEPCSECQRPKNYACYDKCEEISESGQIQACQKLCDDSVDFYCGGSKQKEPCDDITYLCDGNLQSFPCIVYTCYDEDGGERKQTVPCGQEHLCGENQHVKDDICVCKGGWSDCDGDGSCETDGSCEGGAQEVCYDTVDNDGDYLVDCQDLSDCRLQTCALDDERNWLCYEGECTPEDEIEMCEDNQRIIDSKCVDACEIQEDCVEGFVCQYGVCTELTACEIDTDCEGYNEICEEGFCKEKIEEGCVINEDCGEGEICQNNVCLFVECSLDEDCSKEEVCRHQECVSIECDAYIDCVEGYTCEDSECVPIEVECIDNTECQDYEYCEESYCKELRCPEGTSLKKHECVELGDCTTDNDCEEDEICQSNFCIKPEIIEKPKETGEGCTLASDCEGERDICSNGKCKDIPEENYNNLIEEGIIEEDQGHGDLGEFDENYFEEQEYFSEGTYEQDYGDEEYYGDEGSYSEGQDDFEESENFDNYKEPEVSGFFAKITGFFLGITGNYGGEEPERTYCESHEDCGSNMDCDIGGNTCHCTYGFHDCNGDGSGTDGDGCESDDATCGGEREICQGGCGENQYCSEEAGWCECSEGYYNCDGTWWDCESSKQCEACTANSDCAGSQCDFNNPRTIIEFGCFQGGGWEQDIGAVSFSGGCIQHTDGQVDSYINFDTWGDPFEQINSKREHSNKKWCEWELENALKQRKEIQKSFNEKSLEWFFEDFVTDDPEDWDKQTSAIYDNYWKIVETTREIARASDCLEQDFPEFEPLDIEYKSPNGNGEIRIWEEYGPAESEEFEMDLYTPFMQIWIFPPEEFIKTEFKKAMAEGRMPGPEGEDNGPSPEELAEMRNDPQTMEEIRDMVEPYDDGVLNVLVQILDEGEKVFQISMEISEENLYVIEPVETYTKTSDITTEIDFNFMYDLIKIGEKNMRIEHPEWADPGLGNTVENIKTGAAMAGKVSTGVATGKIKVKPMSELTTMMRLIGRISGDEGPQDRRDNE